LFIAALLCAPAVARADNTGEIDWARRVIKARGQGAPDLSSPSISVARLGAERAAKADAMRNLLETLKGASVESGARVGTLLQNDYALMTKVQGVLRGFRVVPAAPGKPNPHYYSDGGVAIDVELPIDSLPVELKAGLKAPAGVDAAPVDSPSTVFVIDASSIGKPASGSPALIDETANEVPVEVVDKLPDDARAVKLSPLRIVGAAVVLSSADAARVRALGKPRLVFNY
jgi:hypothetical protein